MTQLYSKRNKVLLVENGSCRIIEKYFQSENDYENERFLYGALLASDIAVPTVIEASFPRLALEYLAYPTLLDVLEEQERTMFETAPWEALAAWMRRCYSATNRVPSDGNLRNFLWDTEEKKLFGIDFEEYAQRPLTDAVIDLAAYMMEYDPVDTSVKRKAADLLCREFAVSKSVLEQARSVLRRKRSERGI